MKKIKELLMGIIILVGITTVVLLWCAMLTDMTERWSLPKVGVTYLQQNY